MEKNARLSAPEAFVLLSLPRYDIRKALKLGFMGLLAQGVLRIEQEERAGLFRRHPTPHLYVARGLSQDLPPIAASLVRIVYDARPEGLMRDVLRRATDRYGRTLVGFVQDCVGPQLVARGLAEVRRSRFLGLFPLTRFFRTPAGEDEKARLRGLLVEAREIPRYLDRDPKQAVALIAALGGAILLADELRPHYQAIAAALRPPGGGDGVFSDGGGVAGGGSEPGAGHDQTLIDPAGAHFGGMDFGGVDFGAGAFGGLDFSVFDSGAFDSFDAGFSDAGGDGGGGDGGSSGC